MRSLSKIILYVVFTYLFTSCITNKDITFLQDTGKEYAPADYKEYTLKVDDELYVSVLTLNPEVANLFSIQSRSGYSSNMNSYRVYSDSTVDIPYLGAVKVVGLTLRESEHLIESRLKDYITDDFSVRAVMVNKAFYIFGDAGKGMYSIYKDRLNIYEAIALTGPMGLSADRRNMKLLRETPDGTKIFEFDIRDKGIVDSEYFYIEPNDILYLDRSKSNFYKITSFTGLLGTITSTLSFVLLVAQY